MIIICNIRRPLLLVLVYCACPELSASPPSSEQKEEYYQNGSALHRSVRGAHVRIGLAWKCEVLGRSDKRVRNKTK